MYRLRSHTYIYVLLVLVLTWFAIAPAVAGEQVSGPAPDFTLKSGGGENIKLSELRGQVVLINFWASWCGPCRKEMPLLDQLYQQYKPLGFTVLGVNVEEDPSQARMLLGKIPVSFPVLFDGTNAVSKQYDVIAMPTTVIVDRNGNMRYLHKGYMPGYEDAYQQQVRALLTERM
jgi:thiol-disulfide isomerase/thioredoxin